MRVGMEDREIPPPLQTMQQAVGVPGEEQGIQQRSAAQADRQGVAEAQDRTKGYLVATATAPNAPMTASASRAEDRGTAQVPMTPSSGLLAVA